MDEARDFLMDALEFDDALAHYGTEGMEWGKRRYQYEDGSLTPLGRIHYGIGKRREKKAIRKALKAEKKKKQRADKIEKLARTADIDTVLKYSSQLTKEELEDALGRAKLREEAHYSRGRRALYREDMTKEMRYTTGKFENAYQRVNAIRNAVGALTDIYTAYNVIAKDVNEITGEKTLPQFDRESFKKWQSGKDKYSFDTSKSTVFKDSTDYYDTHGSMFGYSDDELKGVHTYFDAIADSYGADRTDWASAMSTKLKDIEMDFTSGARKKR